MKRDQKPGGSYLTVGELASRMNVSVRTLQYYDREGLLPPSAISEGGRRLYTYRDMVMLHQILSLKHLGFSLSEIRERLLPLEEPEEVAAVLSEQAAALRTQIQTLTETLTNIEKLRDEVLSMNEVDFRCYADIVVNLEMHNSMYWALKYFDPETRNHIREKFDQESGAAFLQEFQAVQREAAQLRQRGVAPESPEGQSMAASFWSMVQKAAGGDSELLSKLLSLPQDAGFTDAWQQLEGAEFMEAALGVYLQKLNINPFGEDQHD